MPYELNWEDPSGVHKRFWGDVSFDEVLKSSVELHRHPRFDHLHYTINDFSEVSRITSGMNVSELDDLSASTIGASLSNPNLLVAIVSPNDALSELARRYIDAIQDVWTARLFPRIDEARQWIAQSTDPRAMRSWRHRPR